MSIYGTARKAVSEILAAWRKLRASERYGGLWGLKEAIARESDPRLRQRLIAAYYGALTQKGSWIGHEAQFAGPPCFPHGVFGVFVSGRAQIGRNAVIFQHVTIGSDTLRESRDGGAPILGDNVYVGAGAKVIGNVKIGENCRIGANAVVYTDMPPHSVAVQQPTRIIQKHDLDNRYFSLNESRQWVYYRDGHWVVDP